MQRLLHILYLAQDPADAELVQKVLAAEGISCQVRQVETRSDFLEALDGGRFDLIFADYSLPSFHGLSALAVAKEKSPHALFLFLSQPVGEELVVEALKSGAADFIHKNRLTSRLAPAVRRALQEAEERMKLAQAHETDRRRESSYRAIVEGSPDGILLWEIPTRRILEANPALLNLLGYSSEELRELTIYDLVGLDREEVDATIERVLKQGTLSIERRYRRKDGSLIEVAVSSRVIPWGDTQASLTLIRDLSEKKAMEERLLRIQRLESIGLLAGGIAHDLNNILCPILMNAELLESQISEPNLHNMLSSIITNAQRGADLVKQILSFARGLGGRELLISPQHILNEVVRFARETFPKSIEVRTEMQKDLQPVSGDPVQLQQVLINLCANAKDAMPMGGTLCLSAQNVSLDEAYCAMQPEAKPGPYVVFCVSDTGSGIPPHLLPRIFDPFFTTKEAGRGTGLGLSMVRSIVKLHGGFVQVSSQVGKGSEFRIFLPALPAYEVPLVPEELTATPIGAGQLILVVDDEASTREILRSALELYGFAVLGASDGAEAVSLCAEHRERISLVLIDSSMPIMDGPSCIRALRRLKPSLPIIVMSGSDWEERPAKEAGLVIEGFLLKPFTLDRLIRTVSEVLGAGGPERAGSPPQPGQASNP